jgi:hypothetical protein
MLVVECRTHSTAQLAFELEEELGVMEALNLARTAREEARKNQKWSEKLQLDSLVVSLERRLNVLLAEVFGD